LNGTRSKSSSDSCLARPRREGRLALRDRTLLLFLCNTGARVQEVADLRAEHLDLGAHPLVRLHGKGDKWRTCPLWQQTA
jgi:integrase/recombinase XerD